MKNNILITNTLFFFFVFGALNISVAGSLINFHKWETGFVSILEKKINPAFNAEKLDSITRTFYDSNKSNSFTRFFPEQVLISRVGNIPLQYSYVYSAKGERLITLIQQKQGNTLTNIATESCTYNQNSKITQRTWRSWNGVNWVNLSNDIYTYDSFSNLTQHLSQNWNNNNWVNFSRRTMTYGLGSVLLSNLEENWSGSAWINSVYEFYGYFESNLVSGVRQIWTNNNWQNQVKYEYTYNALGGLLTAIQSNWTANSWLNAYRETYVYGSNNLPVSYVSETYSNNSWSNSEKYNYQHDSLGFVQTAIRHTWTSGTWLNSNKHWFSRNNFGGIQLLLKEDWTVNGWQNNSMHQYGYDENGNALIINVFQWNGTTWGQTSDDIMELFYSFSLQKNLYTGSKAEATYISLIVGLEEPTMADQAQPLLISFNRNDNTIEIFNNSLREEYSSIYIFASDGKYLLQTATKITMGLNTVKLDKLNLKPGMYVALVKNPAGIYQKKFVKL